MGFWYDSKHVDNWYKINTKSLCSATDPLNSSTCHLNGLNWKEKLWDSLKCREKAKHTVKNTALTSEH